MSLQDKLSALMARPGQDPVAKDDVPWWMRFAGRGVGTFGGFIAMFLGIWLCVSFSFGTIVAGLWQIVAGFIVLSCEAPCCCMFVEHIQKLADFMDGRPYWNRAAAYGILALPPIILSFGLTSIFGSGFIFLTGVIYGMMALGRKATAEEMRQAATAEENAVPPSKGMRSNLVAHAQPISFSGAPVFDSNV
ncbi:calcium channel flower isoform X1 [Diabrotica undecimpunctata]|uniref:calcium channel flower isoform X1 n=1 Tax=Diabrotica undecimpunctata TaxID=50387 RepID=UPI003B640FCB